MRVPGGGKYSTPEFLGHLSSEDQCTVAMNSVWMSSMSMHYYPIKIGGNRLLADGGSHFPYPRHVSGLQAPRIALSCLL